MALQPSSKEIRNIIREKAKALREKTNQKSVQQTFSSINQEFRDDIDNRLQHFRRILRDGMADEIKNILLEVTRELAQHQKLQRVNKSCQEMVNEFFQFVETYTQKKETLEKVEPIIERVRQQISETGETPTLQAKLKAALFNAEKSKKEILDITERLIDLREKIEYQIQKDRRVEQKLQDTLKHSLQYVSKTERGKIEVLTRQRLEGTNIEDRIRFLSKFIEQLAQSVPIIRRNEVERLLEEARLQSRKKNFTEAIQILDQLFKFDRKHILAHRLRAEVFEKMGNTFAYLCELRMICEIDTAEARDFFTLAEVQLRQDKLDDAYKLLETAVQKEKNARYLEKLGDVSGQLGYWYRAVQAYQQILKQVHTLVRIKHKLGVALFKDNHEDDAFNILREAIEHRDNNADSRVCVGRKFRQLKATFLAQQCFARAVELDQNHVEAHYWWGMMQFDRGQFEQALEHAETVNQLEPDRPRNLIFLAKCKAAMGEYEESMKILYPIVIRKSPPPPVDLVLCYSEICRNAEQIEQALALVEAIHQRFPHQPQIKAEYGMLLVYAGQLTKAQQFMAPAGLR